MKKLLVIVVTYNSMRWLERCLSSIPAWADVYAFDNDSTDGSADFVKAHYPKAKLVRSAENIGFSRPNNLGMQWAIDHGYDYVYLMNSDAWLEAGALEKLVAASEAHPQYGVLSPLQMTDGYKELDKQFAKRCPVVAGHDVYDVRRVMAAHWLVPVAVIKRIGFFAEELFPHWGQDDEWCQRLYFCGLKVGVVEEARGVHDRAYRQDPVETLVKRNYYTGSLVRLCNPARSIFLTFLFILPFTFVKALKYRSLLPFKYFRQLVQNLPLVRAHRSLVRTRAQNA
ncbi:MAG: glycosyltransferase family 2 protein [Bacteroidales bacterium]|nr:glycosyltransferase family 2 protein [Bacteroidales bacterium]